MFRSRDAGRDVQLDGPGTPEADEHRFHALVEPDGALRLVMGARSRQRVGNAPEETADDGPMRGGRPTSRRLEREHGQHDPQHDLAAKRHRDSVSQPAGRRLTH